MTDKEQLEKFLATHLYMVIAVVLPDGTPWAVPVRVRERQGNKFEWDSMTNTIHSQALGTQPQMAITIFEKTDDTQFALYAKGTAEMVENRDNGLARYRFTAEKSWVNDQTFVKREVTL